MVQFVLLMVSTQILSQLFSFFPGYFCGIFPYPSSSNGCCFLGHNNCAGQPLDLFDGFRVRLVYFGKVDVTVVEVARILDTFWLAVIQMKSLNKKVDKLIEGESGFF